MPKYIELIQDTAADFACEWSELPADIRQEICAEQWRETPYLEAFEDWTLSRAHYVWQDMIAEGIAAFRPNKAQSDTYRHAAATLAEAIMSHAIAWSEKRAEDDYHYELDKSAPSESPVPRSDFITAEEANRGRL